MRVLVLSDTPAFGQSVVRCLGQGGVSSHVWCSSRLSPMRLSRYVRRYRHVPRARLIDTSPAAVARINAACARHDLAAVLATDMPTTLALARIQDQLSAPLGAYPLSDLETLRRLDDKWRFAQLLDEHGIPQPPTRRIERVDDVASLGLDYPLIAKPVIGDGGTGVHRVDSAAELEAGIRRGSDRLPLLVQGFVPGHDVDLSLLANRGEVVAYTIQQALPDTAKRLFLEDEEIAGAGRQIARATTFHGVMHLDMRRDERDGSLAVIECNPRFWGSIEMSLWVGVNFPCLGLELLQGHPVPLTRAVHLGECHATGIAVRRLARALAKGRLAPADLTPASREAWFQNLADPLPELAARAHRTYRRRRGLT